MSILTEKIIIKIDGEMIKEYDYSDVQLIQELQKPNLLRFQMRKKNLIENAQEVRFSLTEKLLGKKVDFSLNTIRNKVEKGSSQENKDELTFSGIIFNVNILRNNLKAGTIIEVIAYSPDYLLIDSPHCISYEQLTLKDIVSKTLEPYSIIIQNDPNFTEKIPYTVQYNENNYSFLNRLAVRYGEWFYYKDTEWVFGKIVKPDKPLELIHGHDVLSYQYFLNMAHLNFTHAHHNYIEYSNPQKKGEDFSAPEMHNLTNIVYNQSVDLFQKETFEHLQCSNPEESYDETQTSAKVQALGKKAQMMVCTGSSNRADLRIGSVLKVKESFVNEKGTSDTCYHDPLLVCKISHFVDNMGNYENQFSGIPEKCEVPPYIYGELFPRAEPQRAVVLDNKDPNKLGRVRVQFLWQKEQNEELMTPWIRIAQPHGGLGKGFYFIPEIEEEVMVGFENGNAEKPYVMGTLYHQQQPPLEEFYDDNNNIKSMRTRNGHTIEFVDAGDEGGYILIYNSTKDADKHATYQLWFSTDEKLIQLRSKGNIELFADQDILMKAENNIVLNAGKHIYREAQENFNDLAHKDIIIKAKNEYHKTVEKDCFTHVKGEEHLIVKKDQNIEIKGKKEEEITQKYKLGAQDIEEEAKMSMKLSSKQHEQKADMTMKIDGGQSLDVKGTMVKIN